MLNSRSYVNLFHLLSYLSVSHPDHHLFFFFFNDTATTEIYTLSLHDALPIYNAHPTRGRSALRRPSYLCMCRRSEEHTSELQSQSNLVCRLLLEKKKNTRSRWTTTLVSAVTRRSMWTRVSRSKQAIQRTRTSC